jgi:hypothetical protein
MASDLYNLLAGGECPVCFATRALDPLAPTIKGEVVGCRKCFTSFRFIPRTADSFPTLERFRPGNANATRCTRCAAIGANGALCASCYAEDDRAARMARSA